ncbi:MAG: hypothetical protein WA718_05585 [Terriglobales bacterium]
MLDMQAAMLSQQLLERGSLVGGRIVQDHDHLAPQVAQQLAQKQANFFLSDVVEIELIVQTQALATGLTEIPEMTETLSRRRWR